MLEAAGYCRCRDCVFWEHTHEGGGLCRRHAPHPGRRVDEVAHWSETRADNGCGEGSRAPEHKPVTCARCTYWSAPDGGLDPQHRRDESAHWWRHAGRCLRYAVLPSPEPGARGFWRATAAADSCGDGHARARS